MSFKHGIPFKQIVTGYQSFVLLLYRNRWERANSCKAKRYDNKVNVNNWILYLATIISYWCKSLCQTNVSNSLNINPSGVVYHSCLQHESFLTVSHLLFKHTWHRRRNISHIPQVSIIYFLYAFHPFKTCINQ